MTVPSCRPIDLDADALLRLFDEPQRIGALHGRDVVNVVLAVLAKPDGVVPLHLLPTCRAGCFDHEAIESIGFVVHGAY